MPYPRGRHASWIVALLFAACSDAPTEPLPPPVDGTGGDLALLFPAVHRDLLVTRESEVLEAPPDQPDRTTAPGEELPPLGETVATPTVSSIYNAFTFVYFNPDHVYAQGEHRYQGNKSKIVTTANAYFDGALIGSQSGLKEQSAIFFPSGLYTSYIQAFTRIYTDHTCGLAADASSIHEAWWEVFAGSPVSTYHKSGMSSFASRRHQPACPPPPPPTSGGGGTGPAGGMCYVNVWYDESTGEIVDWEVLFCENAYGG